MPGKVKVRVLAGRNLPVMDRSSDTTDAYVEVKLGSTTYKTDVCRKSLHPQWDSDWFRYEVDDSELQDEPLQIRLMDHDTYSANDAIGKVYIDLNPLLLPPSSATASFASSTANQHHLNPANTDSSISNIHSAPGKAGGGSVMSGWIPVFDTMHGIRGEVHVVVKVELFSDFNKFRQSSCGVQFFCSGSIPEGHVVSRLQGLVGELVVEGDPEHQWIDKIRTPRASNEARQALFFKLSGELRRRIGLKAIELGANAVLGYQQSFDLEGETGIVVRGIGTAATLVKLQAPPQMQSHLHSPSPSPSPSPANQVTSTTQQEPLEHSISSNSINHNYSPQVTASPNSRRKNQFVFFPTPPSLSRHHISSSISQFAFSPGGNTSKTRSGSPKHLSVSGYGVVRRCPSVETLQKGCYSPNEQHSSESRKGPAKSSQFLQSRDKSNAEENLNEGDRKSKKKQGNNVERPSFVGRLKAVKFLPKSVHGRLSRLWSGGNTNSNSLSQGTSYRRSVSDSAGIGETVGGHFTKSDPIIDQDEFEADSMLFVEKGVREDILLTKPSSYPGTIFPTVTPVEINIQSPGDTVEALIDGTIDHDVCKFTQLPILHSEVNESEEESIIFPRKLNPSLDDDSELPVAGFVPSVSNNGLYDQPKIPLDSSEPLDIPSPMQKEIPGIALDSVELCQWDEKHPELISAGEKTLDMPSNDPDVEKMLVLESSYGGNPLDPVLSKKPVAAVHMGSMLYSCVADGRRKRTLSVQKSADAYDSSFATMLAFDDAKDNPKMPAIKPAKSDSFLAELKKEPVILDFSRVPHRLERKLYDEDIIAQVCQLEEIINRRSMQSPRVRSYSRASRDDEDFTVDNDLKPPTLEVSSWQEEEENEKEDSSLDLTYVDGHFYSNQSSSDEEDDSSSCISYFDDGKTDEDIIEYEQDSLPTNKCFLDTLAPTKLVKGCRKKRSISGKLSPKPEKDISLNSKNSKSSGDKLVSPKNIIKDVHLKLLPIRNKKSAKDKASSGDDLSSKSPRKVTGELSCLASQTSLDSLDELCSDIPNQSDIDQNKQISEGIIDTLSKSKTDLTSSGKVEEIKSRVSFNRSPLSSPVSVRDEFSLPQRESDPSVGCIKTSKSSQSIELLTGGSRVHESCAGNSPLPSHASPSSTSSTSTLQCLCRTPPVPGNPVPEKQGSSPPSSSCQAKKTSGSTTDSHPCLHRRSSDSDLSVTPKGSSGGICGSSKDSVGYGSQWCHQSGSYTAGYPYHPYYSHGPHWGMHHLPHLHHPLMGRIPNAGTNSGIAPDPLDMAEYPFLTMTSYPLGFILHLAGTVSARSVKLLSSGSDGGGGGSGGEEEAWEQRDAWWTEVRMEIRSHARALACDVVVAYSEKTSICDDVCVLSASGTAAVINPNYFYHGIGPEDGMRGVGTSHQCTTAHRELMTSSLDRTDFERDKGVTLVASTTRTRNPSESRESGEEKGVAGSVGGMASSASPPQSQAPPPPPSSTSHHASGAVHFPSCSVCHIPYGPSTVPFQISMAKCALCRRGCVPDVLLATCEPPEGLATIGVGSLIQAYASRGRRGEGGYGGGGGGGGGGMGGGGVVNVGVGGGGSSRGEASAKDISDGLPFLEYDLHRALANKLRLCGMNAVFGLKVEVRVGEKLLVAVATGTGALVSALPKPTVPCVRPQASHQSGQITGSQAALADALQRNLEETVKRCRETFLLDPPKFTQENTWPNGTGRSGNSDTDDSGEDEHQHSLPQLDLSAGNKDTCVLEVDDDEDAEAIALLVAGPPLPPKGFHVAATERIPGLCYCLPLSATSALSSSHGCQIPTCFSCLRPSPVLDPKAPLRVVRNLQMFSQVWRAKLSPPPAGSVLGSQYQSSSLSSSAAGIPQVSHIGQGSATQPLSLGPPSTIALHFNRLLQGVFFKLRKMSPCALANLTFRVDLPEPEEVQLYVVGMVLGLGERLPRRQRVHTSGGNSRDSARKADDSEMIFSLEEEEEAALKENHQPPESSTPKATSVPSSKGCIPLMKEGGPTWAQWPLLGERHGIEVTPLSYIPGGHIQQYLGNLNFFFIRESTCIRESGGLSGFVHSFMTEVLCIVRAHARALGGNALVAFSIVECVLLHNPHKNQGQSLINVSGDVVYASYEQD
ncbi:uncharacterized protein LOC124166342 isoform X2 [Ischnura elegans]|uniref:uncharacterized protein LOC124166342 isoform X2 n=1 Tax=Ischnura elegans TaxID=197161 RepID=UPI001ED89E56|nr:uncharacterized protein LOC124166342 isoform X2 [Ischnura elegans]